MTNNSVTQNDITATAATPPADNAATYAAAVATIQQALDTIAAAMPPKPPALEAAPLKFIRRRLSVKPELMDKAATAAESAPLLQSLIDVPDTRDTLAFNAAFLPVFERMALMAGDLKLSIDMRRAKSGTAALNVYTAAKRISQQGFGGSALAGHVANMKPLVKRGAGGKKKGTTEPPPAVTTAPSTPSAPTAHAVESESAPAKQ
jgi:hypothetical protein